MYFDMVDVLSSYLIESHVIDDIRVIPGSTFLFKRFHPENIMHVFHDDLIPLYFTMRQYSFPSMTSQSAKQKGGYSPSINLDHQLVFIDDWGTGPHFDIYKAFSNRVPLIKRDFEGSSSVVCFPDAVIGLSKLTTWYQYGMLCIQCFFFFFFLLFI